VAHTPDDLTPEELRAVLKVLVRIALAADELARLVLGTEGPPRLDPGPTEGRERPQTPLLDREGGRITRETLAAAAEALEEI